MNGKRGCDMLVADTKKPPVGGFIESGKMFSGIVPECENCSQATFAGSKDVIFENICVSLQSQYTVCCFRFKSKASLTPRNLQCQAPARPAFKNLKDCKLLILLKF